MHYSKYDERAYPLPNFNGTTVEVWEWIPNLINILLGVWLIIYAEIKVESR